MLTVRDWGRMIGGRVETPCKTVPIDMILGISTCNTYEPTNRLECCEGVYDMEDCKPVLRTFDQMTEEEKREFEKMFCVDECLIKFYRQPSGDLCYEYIAPEPHNMVCGQSSIQWLRDRWFDTDGWIEAGLAIKEGE